MTRDEADGGPRWPLRSWQFWCGLLAGIGLGLLLGAALVELEFLALHRKAWVSVLGSLFVAGGVDAGHEERVAGILIPCIYAFAKNTIAALVSG